MPVTDPRVIPLLSARIYYPGSADARVALQQVGLYDVLEHCWKFGSIDSRATGEPTLEFLEGVGLVCRPILTQKDTRSSQFSTSGGLWTEKRPLAGAPQVYWLSQYSAAADQVWSATSTYTLPEDPHVAVQLWFAETPPTHDSATYPPFIRVVFGQDVSDIPQWAIRVDQTAGWFLQRYVSGQWVSVLDLGQPEPVRQLGGERFLILVRPMRDRICLSFDFGRTYSQFAFADGTAATIRQGKFKVQGQGHVCAFNLSQIEYAEGVWTSPGKSILPPGPAGRSPSFSGSRYDAPGSTSVAFADLSSSLVAQYEATLSPASSGSTPFAIHSTPVLYAVRAKFAATTVPAFPMWTDLDAVLAVDIDKGSFEIDESTCSLTARKEAGTQFTWPYANRALIDIQAGWLNDDSTTSNYSVFRGYVRSPEPSQQEYGHAEYTLTIDNTSILLREREWSDFDGVPLGGQTLNSALDEILDSEGMTASYRLWHVSGDFITLPTGRPEDPAYWPKRGEPKWEFMKRMCADWGLELGVLDDGRFATIPKNFADLFITQTWEGAPTSDATNAVHSLSIGFDSSEQATCVIVQGVDEFGSVVYGYATDVLAEGNPASPHFYPWRKLIQEEIPGTCTIGMCVARAQGIAYEHFRVKIEGEIEVPWKPGIGRRASVQVQGTNLGLSDFDILFALTARHTIRNPISDSRSYFGLRRKNFS
jgi:hypothetical protein